MITDFTDWSYRLAIIEESDEAFHDGMIILKAIKALLLALIIEYMIFLFASYSIGVLFKCCYQFAGNS
jgi:hypothetical protein